MKWSKENIYFDGDQYFNAVFSKIEQASLSVWLESYIFEDTCLGWKLYQLLKKKAQEGCDVRIIVDGLGSANFIGKLRGILRKTGQNDESNKLKVRIYHPVAGHLFFQRGLEILKLYRFLDPKKRAILSTLNRRNHRKIVLIDEKIAFVGSYNISRYHLVSQKGTRAWKDCAVMIEGEELETLIESFQFVWQIGQNIQQKLPSLKRRSFPAPKGSHLVRMNLTFAQRRHNIKELLLRIRSAKTRIWITTPYLTPPRKLLKALGYASHRGVDVRILLPRESDVFFMSWIGIYYAQRMLTRRIRVFQYQPRFLHAKNIIVDSWVTVGTSNFNRRSFFHDLEVDVVLSQHRSRRLIVRDYLKSIKHSKEVKKLGTSIALLLGRFFKQLFHRWL